MMTWHAARNTIFPPLPKNRSNYWRKYNISPVAWYLRSYNIEHPKCKYCGAPAKFDGIEEGFKSHCNSEACKKLAHRDSFDMRDATLQRASQYIKDHLDQFRNLNFPHTDPKLGLIKSRRHLAVLSPSLDIFNETKRCILCGKEFTFNCYTHNTEVCDSKRCIAQYAHGHSDPTIPYEVFKHLGSRSIEEGKALVAQYGVEITIKILDGYLLPYKGHLLFRHYTKYPFSLSKNGIVTDEMKARCVICGNEYVKYDILVNSDLTETKVKVGAEYSCHNQQCYVKTVHMYGVKESTRKKLSDNMKSMISSGQFTPKATNSWTNNKTRLDYAGHKFRSTWEVLFYQYMAILGVNLEYEAVRVPYFDSAKQVERIYIVDFYDPTTNTLYEVKPKCHVKMQNFQDKLDALNKNGYYVIIIDDDFIRSIRSATLICTIFDPEIRETVRRCIAKA